MVIDCETCELAQVACGDCVVSVLLGPISGMGDGVGDWVGDAPAPAVAEVADEHLAAIAVLADSGLVPPLRHTSGEAAARRPARVIPLRERRVG